MTLTDEEAEMVFGGVRREFQLDMTFFKSKRDFNSTLNKIINRSRLKNLGDQGQDAIRVKGDEYYPEKWITAHRRAKKIKRPVGIVRVRRGIIIRKWTRSDVKRLRSLYAHREQTSRTIGSQLNRSSGAIRKKASRLKIRKSR